jgi:TRAP-type mannitol/chloroaromatic compound transport system permease small subunit
MFILNKIVIVINKINDWVGFLTSLLFIPISFIALYEIFSRYILNNATIWAWDLNMQLFAPLVMLAGGYTLLHNGHVSVDVLIAGLTARKKAIVELITSSIFFLGAFVLIWKSSEIAWLSFIRKESIPTIWGPPLWTIKMWIPIGFFFLLIQGIAKFLTNLQVIITKKLTL